MSHEATVPTVRRAGPEDAPEVARLLHRFNTEYSYPTPEVPLLTERSERMLAEGQMTVLLGGEGPDGVAMLRFRPSVWSGALDAYLEELYVVPERRRRGIGRALMEVALEVSREAGATRIELGTEEDDTEARALYEKLGFTNREGGPDGPLMFFYERDL
jgi:ribosomal protein S18 acetylase RimI-like enzyme